GWANDPNRGLGRGPLIGTKSELSHRRTALPRIFFLLHHPSICGAKKSRLGGTKQLQPERKKPCIQLLFPSQPPLSAFRALRPMPQRVAEVTGAVATALLLLLFLPETVLVPQALPEAAVAGGPGAGRPTMHPPPAKLLVGTIPIHPAKKCQGGDHQGGRS